MRNFNFQDDDNTSAVNIAGARPQFDERPVEILGDEEPTRLEREEVREDALITFRSSMDDEDDRTGNAAKIAGAALVGLLLVGGSIYAYESSSASRAPQSVAMLPPASQHNATADQAVTPPDASAPAANNAPSASSTPPVISAPKPAHRAGLAAATPAPAASPESAPAATSASAAQDPAANPPMTLTPQTAPPPEQSAMQQPITAPNISGQTAQPTPEVANNSESAPMTPSVAPTVQPSVPQPAPDAAAPSTPSPEQ